MVYHILVGAYSDVVTTIAFDEVAGTLEQVSTLKVGHHPSWLSAHPAHPGRAWTGLEQSDGRLLQLKYDENGKVEVERDVTSGGADPAWVLALKDEVVVANYSSGTVVSLPHSPGSQINDDKIKSTQLSGTGPNKDRQEASHPHQASLYEPYGELLVPDLGADAVYRLKKTDDGEWALRGHIGFEAGGGPRHVAFYDGDIFTLLELSSKVVRHSFPPLPELPTRLASVSTLSQPPPMPHTMLAAEIIIPTPNAEFPTPYLYLTNRNDPAPEGDTIAVFAIAEPGSLNLISEYRTGVRHLRGMAFGGPDERYLVIGGAQGGGIRILERVDGGKAFREVVKLDGVEAPTAFLWL